ncbi:hypothetical protein GpartN1_g419.t1 [Galdieria partita]|uniref:Uncharacterized protein n=1 Tax=Galdieria partita TaxID=83374 RepID=A0A9C7PQ34_9RHOD|nr:hypothetical protein GpartN1_g419.t1 [Galdieria partita]
MAQLATKAVEELYNNLVILQFWKDKPQTPLVEFVECCKKDLRNDKSTLFLETLQFLIQLNATCKELRAKGLSRLPSSPIEHREFMNNALEFLSITFPELHLAKSSFTGSKILETLRIISIRTLANLCRQRDICHENAGNGYDEEFRARSLKLLIANEVRKHKLLKTAAQQKRRELLSVMQEVRKYLESITVQYEDMKADNGMCSDRESLVKDDEQVVHLLLSWISKFTERLSNVVTSDCTVLDSPLPLKSIHLRRYQTWIDKSILRLISCEEEISHDRFSGNSLIPPKDQEVCAIESAISDFIRKTESIISESP